MSEIFDFQVFPIIETKRLLMRQMSEADAPALFEFYRDPEFSRYLVFDVHKTVEDSKDFVALWQRLYDDKDSIRWGIELKETQALIGNAGLVFWRRTIRCAEVGYHIGQAYQRKGYATEALAALLAFGFGRMDLNRVEAYINPGNDASGRVLEKLNFTIEGRFRQVLLKHDKFVDKIWYSLLREEYVSHS